MSASEKQQPALPDGMSYEWLNDQARKGELLVKVLSTIPLRRFSKQQRAWIESGVVQWDKKELRFELDPAYYPPRQNVLIVRRGRWPSHHLDPET